MPAERAALVQIIGSHLQARGAFNFHFRGGPYLGMFSASVILLGFILCGIVLIQSWSRGKRVRIALGSAVLLAVAALGLSQTTALAQSSSTAHLSGPSPASAQQKATKMDA